MKRQRVAMLLWGSPAFDSRVKKEAAALASVGFDVRIFCTTDDGVDRRERVWKSVSLSKNSPPKSPVLWMLLANLRTVGRHLKQALRPGVGRHLKRALRPGVGRHLKRALRTVGRHLKQALRPGVGRHLKRASVLLFGDKLLRMYTQRGPARSLSRRAQSWVPDAIIAHDYEMLTIGHRISRKASTPLYYDSHELWSHRNVSRPKHPLNLAVSKWELHNEKRLMKACSGVITVGSEIAKILADRSGVTPVVVRNIPELPSRQRAPKQQGTGGEFSVAYPGRWSYNRGLETLCDALILAAIPNTKISLIGFGRDDTLSSLQSRLSGSTIGLETTKPVLSAQVPAAIGLHSAAYVGMAPAVLSYELALPNKFFEALFSGLPVIAPRLPEMVRVAGCLPGVFFFDAGSAESLSEAIVEAEGVRGQNAEWLRDRRKRFSWRQELEQFLPMFDELLGTRVGE